MKLKITSLCFIISILELMNFSTGNAQSVSDMDGGYLQIGINYIKQSKPGLANYLTEFSDSLNFPKTFSIDKGYGLSLGFINHHNAFEFAAGGDLLWGHHYQNIGDTISGTVATTDINLNFGANVFPVRWFFIGGNLSICNSTEKYKAGNQTSNVMLETQGDGFSNIFNGYSIGVKGVAGFNFNVSKKGEYNTYLRLNAFYELGLTEFDFYKTFEHRMKYYNGNRKTKLVYPGITISLQFGT